METSDGTSKRRDQIEPFCSHGAQPVCVTSADPVVDSRSTRDAEVTGVETGLARLQGLDVDHRAGAAFRGLSPAVGPVAVRGSRPLTEAGSR